MQTLIHHLPAEQVHENPHASEENRDPQKEELKNPREDLHVLPEIALQVGFMIEETVQKHRHRRRQRQQINPQTTPGEKRLR